MTKQKAVYKVYPEEQYMCYVTSCCGNLMRSIFIDKYKYHGKLCPKCFWEKNIYTTLYLAGTEEAKNADSN